MSDAEGAKLKMSVANGEVCDYIEPFQYLTPGAGSRSRFQISTEEGRYTSASGYEYYHRDHLGNVRAVQGQSGVGQWTDYDPWGLELAGLSTASSAVPPSTNRAKFNGQEAIAEIGTNFLDFVRRGYDAQIGRMHQVDGLADVFGEVSPFSFGLNNPVMNIDPTGDSVVPAAQVNWKTFDTKTNEIGLNAATVTAPKAGDQVMSPVSGFGGWADQIWNGNRTYQDGRQIDRDGVLTPYLKPIMGYPPDASLSGLGSVGKIGDSFRRILGMYNWSSRQLVQAAKSILNGQTAIRVASRADAEELFLGLFQGRGFRNTTGMSGKSAKDFFGGKAGTYHWDDVVDGSGQIINHSPTNVHGVTQHLQIHDEGGKIIRIFFEN